MSQKYKSSEVGFQIYLSEKNSLSRAISRSRWLYMSTMAFRPKNESIVFFLRNPRSPSAFSASLSFYFLGCTVLVVAKKAKRTRDRNFTPLINGSRIRTRENPSGSSVITGKTVESSRGSWKPKIFARADPFAVRAHCILCPKKS